MSLFLLLISHFYVDFCLGVWPIYKTWAHIDLATAGLITGIAGFSAEVLQLFFGYMSDRGYRKKIMLFGILISSGVLLLPFAHSSLSLFALIFCLMLGSSSFHPSGMGFASRLFATKNRTILFFTSGGALGLAFSQLIFSKTIVLFNGQIFPLLFPLLFLIPLVWRHPFPEETAPTQRTNWREFFQPLKKERRPLSLLYMAQVGSYGAQLTFLFLLPDLLRAKGYSDWLAKGGGHLSLVLGSLSSMLLIAFFLHKWSHKTLLFIGKTCGTILIYFFLFAPPLPLPATLAILALIGGTSFQATALITAWGHHIVPSHPSTVSGLLMGFAWCLSNLVPSLAGLFSRLLPYSPVILPMKLIALILPLSLVPLLLVPSKRAEQQAA